MIQVNIIPTVVTWICISFSQGLESKEASQNDTNVDSSRRILFGQEVNPLYFPYLVKLTEQDTETLICGGNIINKKWILTAAHCLDGVACNRVRVLPASLPENSVLQIYADECHPHEQYVNTSPKFDIALIKVKEDLLLEAQAKTIPLPVESHVVYPPGTWGIIAGWGENEDAQLPGHLVYAYAFVEGWDKCNENFKSYQCEPEATCNASDIPVRSLCTQGVGKTPTGTCHGDSGGPLVVDELLAGISIMVLTLEDGRCTVGAPTVYTMVADYLPWIYSFTDPSKDTSSYIVRIESPE